MRRRSVWLGVAVVVAAVAAVSIVALPARSEWTTSSSLALAEFEAGLDSDMKMYEQDAVRHYERAVELDGDFVIAKLRLAGYLKFYNRKMAQELFEEVAGSDLDALHPRERFMVRYELELRERRFKEAEDLLDDYIAENPDDFQVLQTKALRLFSRGESDDAEYLYRRLLELEPNFVLAYGQLGYITMLQTRFAEAEEYFTSYRFIANDQANPHDSLGELYTIQGRYHEAETAFETAIEIKPNFWPPYFGLIRVRQLMNDFRGAEEAIDRFAALEDAPGYDIGRLRCRLRFAEAVAGRSWNRVLEDEAGTCPVKSQAEVEMLTMAHRAACQVGKWEKAESVEDGVRRSLEDARSRGVALTFDQIWPVLLHLEGVRLAVRGELEEAEKRFRDADTNLAFRNSGVGIFKLRNQAMLVETLMAQGEDGAAHRLLAKIRAVNPAIVEDFEETGFALLGLDRG